MKRCEMKPAIMLMMALGAWLSAGCGPAVSEAFVAGVRDLTVGVAAAAIDAYFLTRFGIDPQDEAESESGAEEETGNGLFIKL